MSELTTDWRLLAGHFQDFIASLQPTARERHDAISAVSRVGVCLRSVFRPANGGDGGRDYVVLGGHGKGTAIRPAGAVDMLYVLPSGLRRADGARVSGHIAAALGETFGVVRVAREGWFAVRSTAASAPLVRLIPGFAGRDKSYLVADPAGTWRCIDPSAEAARLRRANAASGGSVTHLILMLKAWRRANAAPIAPLALELLATESISVGTHRRRGAAPYESMVRDFLFWLGCQAGRRLAIPGDSETVELGGAWRRHAADAYRAADAACGLEPGLDDATPYWRRIFGPEFGEDAVVLPWPQPRQARIAAAKRLG